MYIQPLHVFVRMPAKDRSKAHLHIHKTNTIHESSQVTATFSNATKRRNSHDSVQQPEPKRAPHRATGTELCIFLTTHAPHAHLNRQIRLGRGLDFLQLLRSRHVCGRTQSHDLCSVLCGQLHIFGEPVGVFFVCAEFVPARPRADHVLHVPAQYRRSHRHGRVHGLVRRKRFQA